MISVIFAVISTISLIFALLTGNVDSLSVGIVTGAEKAVALTISLCGMMGLWNGVMNVLEKSGACDILAKLLKPFIKIAMPKSSQDTEASRAISSSVAANILGLGNAATPLGIRSMKAMKSIGAENDMVCFAVMNTAPFSLMPSTLIALRNAGGAKNPFDIVFSVWICSFVSMVASVIFSHAFSGLYKK